MENQNHIQEKTSSSFCGKCKLVIYGAKRFNITRITQKDTRIIRKYFRVVRTNFRSFELRLCLKKALALATIIAVIITAYLQSTPQTQAGT